MLLSGGARQFLEAVVPTRQAQAASAAGWVEAWWRDCGDNRTSTRAKSYNELLVIRGRLEFQPEELYQVLGRRPTS